MKIHRELNVTNEEISLEQMSSQVSDFGYYGSREIEKLNEFNNSISKVQVKISIEIVTE